MPTQPRILVPVVLSLHLLLMGIAACPATTDDDNDGWTLADGDCDDGDATVYPGAPELCDHQDNDCDTLVDEDVVQSTWYLDQDGDGYGVDSSTVEDCAQPDGYGLQDGDCDDGDASISPGALEACDGLDQDCDGEIDDHVANGYFPDRDGDGFGNVNDAVCSPQDGYVTARGDCDDDDPAVHAGADDPAGDGVDQDCGGTEGPEPHVGLSGGSSASIAQALSEAADGDTVWVGPGTRLEHGLSFHGKAVTLISTHQAAETVIDAQSQGRVVSFTSQEDGDSRLDGFTLTGGYLFNDNGAGILIQSASPTLVGCVIRGNTTKANGNGAGLFLKAANPTLSGCRIEANVTVPYIPSDLEADGGSGGGLYLESSSPLLTGCTIADNQVTEAFTSSYVCSTGYCSTYSFSAGGYGGGVYMTSSSPVFADCTFSGNQAVRAGSAGSGGGLYLYQSTADLQGCSLADNEAQGNGGGLYLYQSAAGLQGCTLAGNEAGGYGGGLYLYASTPTISSSAFTGNRANGGGGMYLNGSSGSISDSTLQANTASSSGGGMALSSASSPSITRCTFADNTADGSGGAVSSSGSSPAFSQCTVVGNAALVSGGGVAVTGSSSPLTLTNSVLAFNPGGNLYTDYETNVDVRYCDLYASSGINHNLSQLDASNLTVDPAFVRYPSNGDAPDDLHLAPGSPAIDAGDPATLDPDGSRADMGRYGGSGADMSYYADQDGDGMYDGWEAENGLDPIADDADGDADGDGASNAQELAAGTHPQAADTDGDGASDGLELSSGSDPADWYAQPGVTGPATARVPEDFSTIQAAIDAVVTSGSIQVAAGTWTGSLRIQGKDVTLSGPEGAAATVLEGSGDRVLTVSDSQLTMEGFTLQGGSASRGGGLYLSRVQGTLTGLVVQDNFASRGGGIYLLEAEPAISSCTISGNTSDASDEFPEGAGIYLETSDPVITDTTITDNLTTGYGGGLYAVQSSPTLTASEISSNEAGKAGGGLYLYQVQATLNSCTLRDNATVLSAPEDAAFIGAGGGMYQVASSAVLTDCTVAGNNAVNGGGIYQSAGSLSLIQTTMSGNAATAYSYTVCYDDGWYGYYCEDYVAGGQGGALYIDAYSSFDVSSSTWSDNAADRDGGAALILATGSALTDVVVTGNRAGNRGGGIYWNSSSPTMTRCTLRQNDGGDYGGGLYLENGSPVLTNCLLAGNRAGSGGAVYAASAVAMLHSCTVAGNLARVDGVSGIYLGSSSAGLELENSVLAYNPGFNVYTAVQPFNGAIAWSDLYNPACPNHNLGTVDSTVLTIDPGIMRVTPGMDDALDDWHLAPSSALIDAGDPAVQDPDGSRADMGAYGGPNADRTYYVDQDGDGLYDGWEQLNGLEPTVNDAGGDPDGDGATNAEELAVSDPRVADTDGDGVLDGTELEGGGDPADWYSRPGSRVTAQVPGDFPSIQAAIDAVMEQGTIEVAPGTYTEGLEIAGKRLTLAGSDVTGATTLAGAGGRVINAVGAELELSGFTVTGGSGARGGGANLAATSGALSDLVVTGNAADYGGGLYLFESHPRLDGITVTDNTAEPACEDAYMVGYVCTNGYGGGLYLDHSAPSITRITCDDNTARAGGAMYLSASSPTLDNVTLTGNIAEWPRSGENYDAAGPTGSGAGLYLNDSSPSIQHALIADNAADYGAGGIAVYHSSPALTSCVLSGNSALFGGGMEVVESSPTITSTVITGNVALYSSAGGGIYVSGNGAEALLVNTILAYNTNYNLYNYDSSSSTALLSWCDLYSVSGEPNHNLASLDSSNLTVEPGFLSYADGTPADLHLASSSPLVNAGEVDGIDADGSRTDMGAYGGDGGDGWDLDGDGFSSWFWPGTLADAPAGFEPADYDADDGDPSVH